MATPITFDVFSRILAGGFDEKNYIRMRTAGQRFFGRPETGAFTVFSPSANAIDIEILRANQRLAALVPRGAVGRFVGTTHADLQQQQGTMFSRQYPLIEEESNLDANQLLQRVVAYEGPYENLSEEDRTRILGRRAYLELTRRMIRLQEFLAWQSLTLGVQSASNITDVTVNIYDWRRNGSNTVTPAHGWGNAAGVPLTDIDSMCDQLLFAGQLVPDFMIWGGLTMRYFLANAQVSSNYANKLYFNLLSFDLNPVDRCQVHALHRGGPDPLRAPEDPQGLHAHRLHLPLRVHQHRRNGIEVLRRHPGAHRVHRGPVRPLLRASRAPVADAA